MRKNKVKPIEKNITTINRLERSWHISIKAPFISILVKNKTIGNTSPNKMGITGVMWWLIQFFINNPVYAVGLASGIFLTLKQVLGL